MSELVSAAEKSQRQRLLEAAADLLADQVELTGVVDQAARHIGCSSEKAALFFARDVDVVHAIYARITYALEEKIEELPAGSWRSRLAEWMKLKFSIAAPYRNALASIAISALDASNAHGVWNAQTESIRCRSLAMLAQVVHGSEDCPSENCEEWIQGLYELHLAMMFAWCLREKEGFEKYQALRVAGERAIDSLESSADLLPIIQQLRDRRRVQPKGPSSKPQEQANAIAHKILACVFHRRRLVPGEEACRDAPCEHCYAIHLPRIRYFMSSERPIHFVLPAFPAKSPSRTKTLGALPDKAEEIGLRSLESLCHEIQEIYAPGASIVICSDGHVFSDCVGVTDEEVVAYSERLRMMMKEFGWNSLSFFDMQELYDRFSFNDMRASLMSTYAMSLEQLEQRAASSTQHRRMVDGIHRFLFEELVDLMPDWSRTHCRNVSRPKAYETVRRSDAWGKLVADVFPYSLRLSIHPQTAHASKMGILLGETEDVWLTPWHSAAVNHNGTWKLMKTKEALAAGASIVFQDKMPCYLELK